MLKAIETKSQVARGTYALRCGFRFDRNPDHVPTAELGTLHPAVWEDQQTLHYDIATPLGFQTTVWPYLRRIRPINNRLYLYVILYTDPQLAPPTTHTPVPWPPQSASTCLSAVGSQATYSNAGDESQLAALVAQLQARNASTRHNYFDWWESRTYGLPRGGCVVESYAGSHRCVCRIRCEWEEAFTDYHFWNARALCQNHCGFCNDIGGNVTGRVAYCFLHPTKAFYEPVTGDFFAS